jgi:alpha-galactosidase/6-phospho-beta-glucosidase family protein
MEGIIKRQNEFPIRELWLVDIEDGREKMAIIAGLTRRMLEKMGWIYRFMKPLTAQKHCSVPILFVLSSGPAAWKHGSATKGYR